MKTSEKIDLIVPALLKVKSKIQAVIKDSNNPFFKSKYADLNAHLDTVEPLLAENEIVLLQPTTVNSAVSNTVETVLIHKSGQYISADLVVNMPNLDAQKLGAAITYFRRYTLGSLLGMKAEDDDGNKASDKVNPAQKITTNVSNGSTAVGSSKSIAYPPVISGQAELVLGPGTSPAKPSFRKPKPVAAPIYVTGTVPDEDI